MSDEWPKIRARRTTPLSPWVAVIERDIEFAPGTALETYHAVAQSDYIAIVARTPNGRILIVRQFRPAVEDFTWELPAGLVDAGEDPAAACRRELLEETGFPSRTVTPLGTTAPCTGRLSNRIHSYFVETGDQIANFAPEVSLTVEAATPTELLRMIMSGEFVSHLHLGALLLAQLHSLLKLA
jgi:ADP-ribose pyrophosphatase